MNANQIILYMIIACLALLAITFILKPLKKLAKLAINSILGLVILFITNFLLSPLNLSVGVNLLSAIIIGILGLPGIIFLYILVGLL